MYAKLVFYIVYISVSNIVLFSLSNLLNIVTYWQRKQNNIRNAIKYTIQNQLRTYFFGYGY